MLFMRLSFIKKKQFLISSKNKFTTHHSEIQCSWPKIKMSREKSLYPKRSLLSSRCRVPSSPLWCFTSLSGLTRPTSTPLGPMLWAGFLGFSVFSWFLCGSYLNCFRWKGRSGRYVQKPIQISVPFLKYGLKWGVNAPHRGVGGGLTSQ